MKQSEIRFHVELDQESIPDKIFWRATDAPFEGQAEAKAIMISVWDVKEQNTLRLDLWTKDMLIDDMKIFCLESLLGLTTTMAQATQDEFIVAQMKNACDNIRNYLEAQTEEKA
ncbi:gliding motility protein GldC [Hugenholtzia roseola]|uniref:gliding motility protein GldC n=1 Tax=Hugenholtzia roseola TaxID=1002 RepID=UPI000414F30E|nr:gliding motility protein GldC [Hugenholtzia roseola]